MFVQFILKKNLKFFSNTENAESTSKLIELNETIEKISKALK
jgi:hypothetical protein